MRTVDQLLAPISFSEFHGRHYGKKPLLVARRSPAYYDGLLTLDALNAHLGEGSLLSTELRLIRDGEQLDESDFTYPDSSANARFAGDAADKEAVFARFYEGYTIAISSYERHRSAVLHLRHDMERVFHAPVLTYVFLTPRNAQGFSAHADAQDTFILQFAGTKQWTVFKGRKRVLSATLEPGDFLYLPRGFVHEARSADAVSGHITFVLYAYTYADLLRQIADNAHASDWLRKSLPPDFRSVARNEEFLRHVHEFFDDADLSAYLYRMHGDFAEDRLPDTTDRLADYVKLPSINADTRFRMRSVVSHELMNGGRWVVLTFNRKSLEFPAAAAKSIRFMIEAGEFGVNAVPGRTDKNLALCGTLVREGFLTIV
jgi:hypothetical protein